MKSEDRKAAVAAYKERKVSIGIYAVSCIPTAPRWVGHALDLSTIQNRLTFTLSQGISPHRTLQAAWREHGAESFMFEVVESLSDEALTYGRDGVLKDRLGYWCLELGAQAI